MDSHLFFNLFTPVIIFSVAFDMDVYLLHKLFWQVRSYLAGVIFNNIIHSQTTTCYICSGFSYILKNLKKFFLTKNLFYI